MAVEVPLVVSVAARTGIVVAQRIAHGRALQADAPRQLVPFRLDAFDVQFILANFAAAALGAGGFQLLAFQHLHRQQVAVRLAQLLLPILQAGFPFGPLGGGGFERQCVFQCFARFGAEQEKRTLGGGCGVVDVCARRQQSLGQGMQDLAHGIGGGLTKLKAQQRPRRRAAGQSRTLQVVVASAQVRPDAGIGAAHGGVDANPLEGFKQLGGQARVGEVMVEQPAIAGPGQRLGFRQPIQGWQARISRAQFEADAAELPPGDLLQGERPVDARFNGVDGFGQIEGVPRLHGVGGASVQGVAGFDVQVGAVHALREQRQGLLDIG